MTCTVEYDISTGAILGVLSPGLPDDQQLPSGRAFIRLDIDWVDASTNIVDITQSPPVIIPYTPPTDYISQAKTALAYNDTVAIRCLKAGVTYTSDWQTYDITLRQIVSGATQGPLPSQPSKFPIGS